MGPVKHKFGLREYFTRVPFYSRRRAVSALALQTYSRKIFGTQNQLLASQTVFGTAGSGETNWSTTSCTSTTLFGRFFFISHHLQVKTSFPDSYPWTPRHLGFTHWDTSIAEVWASCKPSKGCQDAAWLFTPPQLVSKQWK